MAPSHSVVEICRKALRDLDPQKSLITKELHDKLYVPRDEPTMDKLRLRLEFGAMEEKSKLIFSGHIGSGKSTELYHLKRTLDQAHRATILLWSIRDEARMSGLTTSRFLEGLARALYKFLCKMDDGKDPTEIERRVEAALARRRTEHKHAEGAKASATLGPSLGILAGQAGIHSERTTTEARVFEEPAGPDRMLDLVNTLIGEVRAGRRPGVRGQAAPVVLICDDLEKLDLKTAMDLFSDGLVLSEIDACVIFTAPISLLYSENRRMLREHFDDGATILPLVKVRDRAGRPSEAGIRRMLDMIGPRLPDLQRVMAEEAARRLALASGGVFRDLVRMLRELCLWVVATRREQQLGADEMRKAESVIRNDFLREVPGDLVDRLVLVHQDPDGAGGRMDEKMSRLLNLAAVLEYANDDTWYRVHPLVDHLLGPTHADRG